MKSVLIIACCLVVSIANAQVSPNRQLTLDDALKIAMEQNISVKLAANSMETAGNSVWTAYGAYVPQLYAGASFSRNGISSPPTLRQLGGFPIVTPRTESYYNTYRTGFGLTYTVFDGFNREANLKSALTTEDQSAAQYERTRQMTAFTVESSYLNVLRNDQLVKVAEENIKRDRRQLERITESNRVGSASIADVYRQQSIVASDEVNLISAQNTYDKSKADLLNLLALDPGADYVVADSGIDQLLNQQESSAVPIQKVGNLTDQALTSRPDYMSTKYGGDLADYAVTRAWSAYYPTVNVSGGFSTDAQAFTPATSWTNRATTVGLTVSWQLPELFSSITRIQNAKVGKESADLQIEQKARDVRVEVTKAVLDLEASRKQVEATQKSLQSAEQDRRVAEERYNLGAGTLVDLYVANANYVNAQANNVNAKYNYIISQKNLEYVVGERKY